MSTPKILVVCAIASLALALTAGQAAARINKKQLVGTWSLVSTDNTKPDGSKVDVYGQNPKGILTFDKTGHYTLIIVRADLPKFAGSASNQGTAEENKAVLSGMIASFGTYSLGDDGTVTSRIDGSSFPNLAGAEQKRIISSLTRRELKYTNPATATGTKAETTWKRVR
jgi:hypothetical protein